MWASMCFVYAATASLLTVLVVAAGGLNRESHADLFYSQIIGLRLASIDSLPSYEDLMVQSKPRWAHKTRAS